MTEPTDMPFEVVDHTADIGVIAYGRNFQELLENAALGMFSLMADLATVKPKERRKVNAQTLVAEQDLLLLRWLKELHYLQEQEHFIPCKVSVTHLSETEVQGVVEGELLHEGVVLLHHIKAVTHHLLHIQHENDRLKVQIIFDV